MKQPYSHLPLFMRLSLQLGDMFGDTFYIANTRGGDIAHTLHVLSIENGLRVATYEVDTCRFTLASGANGFGFDCFTKELEAPYLDMRKSPETTRLKSS